MKFKFITLISAIILTVSITNGLEMQPKFREGNYKNIAFGVSMGGSSHHNWVLSIIDILGQRGHNVSYLAVTEEIRFGKPYSNIKIVDIGKGAEFDKVGLMRQIIPGKNDILSKGLKFMAQNYERDYFTFLNYFENNNIDVVLCDHFTGPCVDAAKTFKIPLIITSATDLSKESSAPYINNDMKTMNDFTTEFQSFSKRFKNKFIVPWTSLYKMYPFIKELTARRRAIGIDAKFESPEETWKDSLKLVNTMFGYTPARPVGALAEFIGPIIPKSYNPLTEEIEKYLNSHKRIAYVAFGQNAVPSDENIKFVLMGLLESLEGGSLDGFLWATVNSASFFPDSITTSSGIKYNVKDMLDHIHPHARMIKWAPQTAVLLHPSTTLFVSHGGLGSWYESMYSGTPMIMFPFFGDQPGNALTIERSGLGGILKYDGTIKEAIDLFKKITEDEGGEIKSNVKRMQALTQIHSEHGMMRGADIVEEVVYTHKNGELLHRQSVANRMSYIKSHNIDLYASLVFILAFTFALLIAIGWNLFNYIFPAVIDIKQQKKNKQHKLN